MTARRAGTFLFLLQLALGQLFAPAAFAGREEPCRGSSVCWNPPAALSAQIKRANTASDFEKIARQGLAVSLGAAATFLTHVNNDQGVRDALKDCFIGEALTEAAACARRIQGLGPAAKTDVQRFESGLLHMLHAMESAAYSDAPIAQEIEKELRQKLVDAVVEMAKGQGTGTGNEVYGSSSGKSGTSGGSGPSGASGTSDGTSRLGEGYKCEHGPCLWRISSELAAPVSDPVDCPKNAAACTTVQTGGPAIPGGAADGAVAAAALSDRSGCAKDPKASLILKAGRSLLVSHVMAYLTQAVRSTHSSAEFGAELDKLEAACPKGSPSTLYKKLTVNACRYGTMSEMVTEIAEGARAAYSTGLPSPAELRSRQRSDAIVLASQLRRLRDDIAELRKNFNREPPSIESHWKAWYPFQTAVKILDASTTGFREHMTDNATRPCSDVNSFGWGGPWTGSIDAAAPDEPNAVDKALLYDRGLLVSDNGTRVPTNHMQRCKIEASLLDRDMEEMAAILAEYPELGELAPSGKHAFDELGTIADGAQAESKLDELMNAQRVSKDGAASRILGSVSDICVSPDDAGKEVFLNPQLLEGFMSCGDDDPAVASLVPSADARRNECQQLRASSALVCQVRKDIERNDTLKMIAVTTAVTGLDLYGTYSLGGMLQSAVGKNLFAVLAKQFTRKQLTGMGVGLVVGAGLTARGMNAVTSGGDRATANYYAGRMALDYYKETYAQVTEGKRQAVLSLFAAVLVGQTIGGLAVKAPATVLEGPLGAEYRTVLAMPAGAAREARVTQFAGKLRVELQNSTQVKIPASFSDTDVVALTELQAASRLSPDLQALSETLRACADEACRQAAVDKLLATPK